MEKFKYRAEVIDNALWGMDEQELNRSGFEIPYEFFEHNCDVSKFEVLGIKNKDDYSFYISSLCGILCFYVDYLIPGVIHKRFFWFNDSGFKMWKDVQERRKK